MKTKSVLIVFICIVFAVIVCLSCVSAFSIAQIEITFVAVKDSSSSYFRDVKEDLDVVLGKSLLFFDRSEVERIVERYPYLELTGVEKDYTNKLKVSICEREEQYAVFSDGAYYMLDQNGFVLDKRAENTYNLDSELKNIALNLDEIGLMTPTVGSAITVADRYTEWLNTVMEIGKAFYLRNTVDSVTIDSEEEKIVLFVKTGISITIERPLDFSKDKLKEAWSAYDTLTDKQKSTGSLSVYRLDDGTIRRLYSPVTA